MKRQRAEALAFLRRTMEEAQRLADAIDPQRRRDYGADAILRGLDAITGAASRALTTEGIAP